MSGVIALFHRDGQPVDPAMAWAMLEAAPHRGPDGMRVACFGRAALGQAKLAITPEEIDECQPLTSARSGCTIVADVRLDNRDELFRRLRAPAPSGISDADLLLRLHEEFGEEMLPWLLGDFAFAIWDPRRQRLLCARDTAGQRDLYYRLDHRTFAAASEIQQLLQDPAVPVEPCEEHIRNFLTPFNMSRNARQSRLTFYEGILALEAGHTLVVDRDGVRVRRFWELRPPAEIRYRRADDYAEHFRTLLFEAVRARLRSAYPAGALMSGGLDSSSIVCTTQELFKAGAVEDRGFTSFTTTYEGLSCDERPFVEEIAAKYGFAARFVPPAEFAGRLQPEPHGFIEAPPSGPTTAVRRICAAAAALGVRVLLTGEVADSVIGGTPLVLDQLVRRGQPREFGAYWRACRRLSPDSPKRLAAFALAAPLLPLRLQRSLSIAFCRRLAARTSDTLLPSWIPQPLRIDLERRSMAMNLDTERARQFSNPVRHEMQNALWPPETVLNATPWPIEVARPFADRRLHEFMLAIPPELDFDARAEGSLYAGQKQVLRWAMRGVLPESVRTRTVKTLFDDARTSEVAQQWAVLHAMFGPGARPRIAERGYVERDGFWEELQLLHDAPYSKLHNYALQLCGVESLLLAIDAPRPASVRLTAVHEPSRSLVMV